MAGALYMGVRTQMDLVTLMRWTFFPNPNHVVNSNIRDIDMGWVNFYWRMIQMLIMFFGATHGFNGLCVVAEDHLNSTGRVILRWVVGIIWLAVLAIAFITIFTS
jgi:succinate dehydrogenase hydrophobic anchor subunit